MGSYTEVFFRAEVDEEAYRVLERIFNGTEPENFAHLDPFFRKTRAWAVFRGQSSYHPGPFHTLIDLDERYSLRCVSFRSSLKNYDGEIEAFFNWVLPHVQPELGRQFIGYSLHEESQDPTLYHTEGESL